MVNTIGVLEEISKKISAITEAIKSIATQIKLLALKSSIETARHEKQSKIL